MPNYYKKPLIYWFSFLLFILVMTTLTRCAKPPMASQNELVIKNDSVCHTKDKETNTNQAVIDSLKMVIGDVKTGKEECDSVCNVAMQDLLQRINTQKVSGDNSYGILYDQHRKLLIMYQKMAATKNVKEVTVDVRVQKLFITKTITKTVSHTPNFMKWSAWFGWLCMVIAICWGAVKIKTWPLRSST